MGDSLGVVSPTIVMGIQLTHSRISTKADSIYTTDMMELISKLLEWDIKFQKQILYAGEDAVYAHLISNVAQRSDSSVMKNNWIPSLEIEKSNG